MVSCTSSGSRPKGARHRGFRPAHHEPKDRLDAQHAPKRRWHPSRPFFSSGPQNPPASDSPKAPVSGDRATAVKRVAVERGAPVNKHPPVLAHSQGPAGQRHGAPLAKASTPPEPCRLGKADTTLHLALDTDRSVGQVNSQNLAGASVRHTHLLSILRFNCCRRPLAAGSDLRLTTGRRITGWSAMPFSKMPRASLIWASFTIRAESSALCYPMDRR